MFLGLFETSCLHAHRESALGSLIRASLETTCEVNEFVDELRTRLHHWLDSVRVQSESNPDFLRQGVNIFKR